MALRDWWDELLDLIFPLRCLSCSARDSTGLCSVCRASFEPIRWVDCRKCGMPGETQARPMDLCRPCRRGRGFDLARGAYYHEDGLREALAALKFGGRLASSEGLSQLLAEAMVAARAGDLAHAPLADIPYADVDIVCPVPLHRRREHGRGFNQASLLARPVAEALGRPCDETLLRRIRDTRPQPGLSARDRAKNMDGAFEVRSDHPDLAGARVLLVDDVITTGATSSACAMTLRQKHASRVWSLSLAMPDSE